MVEQNRNIYALRVLFSKEGVGIYISQLDMFRLLLRALRRAEIPFRLTQGFRPRPKMQFLNPAQKIGSLAQEDVVFFLAQEMSPAVFIEKMRFVLPGEIQILSCTEYVKA